MKHKMESLIFQTEVIHYYLISLDLSDMHSNELAKCIKTLSGHIKTIDLSKNKLSDEGIGHVIKALCDS